MDRTTITPGEIHRIEAASERAWPAAEVFPYDGWEIRITGDIGRRVNSVSPLRAGSRPVEEKIARCERFYRERSAPPMFKLTDASQPAGLDALLAQRGYRVDAPVSVQTRALGTPLPVADVALSPAATEAWVAANIRIGGHGTWNPALFPQLLDRIERPTAFAGITEGGTIVATGLAVAEDDLVGLFEIVTDRSVRGRGLATTVIGALLAWGEEQGASTGYLQVMLDNQVAQGLYARLGFTEAYRYWYCLAHR